MNTIVSSKLRGAVIALAVAAVAPLLAACGGGAASRGIASVGSSSTSTTVVSSPAGDSGPPPSAQLQKAQLSYSKCMRVHGVLNFPDPNAGGGYPDGYMKQINANSTQYLTATKDCRPLATAADMAPWTQAQWEAYDARLLKISKCMRAHGIADFPDPKGGDQGGWAVSAPGAFDSSSPQYAAAAKACNGPPGIAKVPSGSAGAHARG